MYPVINFASYTVAVTQSRAKIVRHSFLVDPHYRFPVSRYGFSLTIRQVAPSFNQSISGMIGHPTVLLMRQIWLDSAKAKWKYLLSPVKSKV